MFDKDNQEAIELMVDLHNDVNDDALKLISEYYLDITNPIGTKITDITEKEISLVINVSDKKIDRVIQFPQEAKDSNEVSAFFYTFLNQARNKAPKNYPKTRIENLIEKTLNLKTYITKVTGKRTISSNILEITFEGGLEDLPDLGNDAFVYFIVHQEIGHNYPEGFKMQNFRDLGILKKTPTLLLTIRSGILEKMQLMSGLCFMTTLDLLLCGRRKSSKVVKLLFGVQEQLLPHLKKLKSIYLLLMKQPSPPCLLQLKTLQIKRITSASLKPKTKQHVLITMMIEIK